MSQNFKIEDKLNYIVTQIKEEVLLDEKYIALRPPGPSNVTSEPILFSDELAYLNAHWNDWATPSEFSSHRPIVGNIFSKIKKKIQRYLFEVICKEYLERERSFNSNLVRCLNLTARYIDKKHEESFYALIKKVDTDINLVNSRNDEIFSDILKKINSPHA